MIRRRIFFVAIVVVVVVGSLFLVINKKENTVETTSGFQPIEEVYDRILQSSIVDISEEKLLEGALRGMTAALKDPYSTYYNEQEAKAHHESLADTRVGIGIEVMEKAGKFIVVSPLKGGSAERAGIQPFDEIVQVNAEKVAGKTFSELLSAIRGEKNTEVKLVVYRESENRHIPLSIKRQAIKVTTVEGEKIEQQDHSIGVVTISLFGEKTAEEWLKVTQRLVDAGVQGFIIDVRSNPGGYLTSVQAISSTLLKNGKVFTYMQNGRGEIEPLTVKKSDMSDFYKKMERLPVVILQNSGSASASEVLATAIQGNNRGIVIGTTSFGKGTVQETWKISNGGEVKLSSHRWLTPTRNWIHGKGVKADLEVEAMKLYEMKPLPVGKTYDVGDLHEDVAYGQKVLNAIGDVALREDGFFDVKTKEAVQFFMKQSGLKSEGEMDGDFYMNLRESMLKFQSDEKNDQQLQMAIGYIFNVLK